MKKTLFTAVAICLSLIMLVPTAFSANIGDAVNMTMHTDIVAYIDDAPIDSHNINGYTAVVAEDLARYGFSVKWVADQRALYIEQSGADYTPPNITILPVPKEKIGSKKQTVYYTDIKTYLNGKLVESFNIGGRTIIMFETLMADGEVTYDNAKRRLDYRRKKKVNNLKEIILVPEVPISLDIGESYEFSAIAEYNDGKSEDYTNKLKPYIQSGEGVVKISGNKITAIKSGKATIKFRNEEAQKLSISVEVSEEKNDAEILSLVVDDTTTRTIGVNDSFTIKATAVYSDGDELGYKGIEPYIYYGSGVISIDKENKVTGLKTGTARIRFRNTFLDGVEISVVVKELEASEILKSLSLNTTTQELAVGKTYTIGVTGHYQDGSEKAHTDFTPYIYSGAEYIKLSGKKVTGVKAGTAKIKFSEDLLAGKTLTINVKSDTNSISSVTLDETSINLTVGKTYTITATAEYENGTEKNYTAFTPYVSTGSSYVNLSGKKITAIKAGTAKIRFTDDYLSSKILTVKVVDKENEISSVYLDSTSKTLAVGKTYTITATAEYEDGTEKNYTAFTPYISTGTSYVKLSGKKITATKAGTAKIRFTDDYLSSKVLTIKVVDEINEISSVYLDSTSKTLAVGKTYTITATAEYDDGTEKNYTEFTPYISTGTSYIKLSGKKITATKAGTAKIRFTDDYLSSKVLTIKVVDEESGTDGITSVSLITATDKTIAVGKSLTITAEAEYDSGKTKSYTDLKPYVYSGEDVVELSGNTIKAIAVGEARIKFECEYLTGVTMYITVPDKAETISSVTLKTATTQKINIGESFEIEATAKMGDGTTVDFFELEPYNSSQNGVVRIKNNTITGVNEGVCTIKFQNENVTKSIKVTVVDPTANIKSVALDATSHKLAVGDKITISATATYTDRSTGVYEGIDPYIKSGSSYVTLSDGVITAKKAGTAKIGFDDEWLSSKTVTVTVVGDVTNDITKVTLDTAKTLSMSAGDSFTILATATLESGATHSYTELGAYVYSGSSVVVEGNKVVAVRPGESKIRFESTFLKSTTNTITITVTGTDSYITEIKPDESEIELEVGKSYTIKATAVCYDKKEMAYTKDDLKPKTTTAGAKLIKLENNVITATSVGNAVVSFGNSLVKGTISVKVVEAKTEQ